MSEELGAWPVLPVILNASDSELHHPNLDQRWDNRVAALESEHYNLIREIYIFDMTNSRWKRFAAAMQKPFPELTLAQFRSTRIWGMTHLREELGLSNSAGDLVTLLLFQIPATFLQRV